MAADRISISQFLLKRSGGPRLNTSDILTYLYLTVGTILMFGPVLWLVFSSFKTQAGLGEVSAAVAALSAGAS